MSYTIQNAVYPTFSLCSQKELYFRHNEFVDLDMGKSIFNLATRGKILTDTYFNSISIGKWKKHTLVEDLSLNITFRGKIKITWHMHRLHFTPKILDEQYVESEELSNVSIPLNFWKNIEDGILFFEIEALSQTTIENFQYTTNSAPKNHVKLGIVITHFNRQEYVLPAIQRLESQLLNDVNYKDKLHLIVVDNSQNLPDFESVTLIKNENLGGSGGFTRGLTYLQEEGSYTHCLFMDDDASCEVESIKRTLTLLEFAKNADIAVAGAMLREAEVFRQFENGAKFDGLCRPNKCGLDMRSVHDLLINELEEHIDYGGWWFFAFPIRKVTNLAFPYFVRGDDIGFGLKHKFDIITLNGISTWGDDFALKNGPLPYYLDVRNHIMQHMHGLIDGGLKGIIKTTLKMSLRNLLTYHYETGLAAIYAIEDVNKGKVFWETNVDMSEKRKEITSLIHNEKIHDIPLDVLSQSVAGNPHESKLTKVIRLLTLNGHLLPKCFFKKGMVWQDKGFGGHLREVYRYNQVIYIHWASNKGFILEHNKRKFFSHLVRYVKAIYQLSKNYQKLKNEYQNSYDEFTSKEFWNKQFKQD